MPTLLDRKEDIITKCLIRGRLFDESLGLWIVATIRGYIVRRRGGEDIPYDDQWLQAELRLANFFRRKGYHPYEGRGFHLENFQPLNYPEDWVYQR